MTSELFDALKVYKKSVLFQSKLEQDDFVEHLDSKCLTVQQYKAVYMKFNMLEKDYPLVNSHIIHIVQSLLVDKIKTLEGFLANKQCVCLCPHCNTFSVFLCDCTFCVAFK